MSISRIIFSWLCIFSILFLPAVSSAGLLLCLGDDGHVAIEKSFQGSCADQNTHADEGISQEHCGTCLDVPLFQDNLRKTDNNCAEVKLQTQTVSYLASAIVDPLSVDNAFADRPNNDFTRAERAYRKTIVLII